MSWLRPTLFLALAGLPLAAGAVSPDSPEVVAAWHKNEIEFTYMGFTTRYSCDGLRDKMRMLLKVASARPDYKVTTRACTDLPGRVEQFPRVRMVFYRDDLIYLPDVMQGERIDIALAPGNTTIVTAPS